VACLDENEVIELLEGRLAITRRAEALIEVARCESCRAMVHDCLATSSGTVPVDGVLPHEVAGYRLGDVLGAGAGGVVVRARDPVLERDVALKLIHTRGDADPYDDALREARTLATVRHPAVVSVYAAGSVDHVAFVAMELVKGDSLARRIASRPLPWRDAAATFGEVAAGLEAIHAAGLVHRDLKPGNLLVDGDRLRIADFGLAVRTIDASLAGTLPYLAPELLAGAPADRRSDIYALFATLFEAITGERPYRELDRRALRAAAEHGHPDWPSSIPARVRRVIETGLAPDPQQRWPDAASARHALVGLVARRASPRAWVALGLAGAAVATVAISTRARGETCDLEVPAWSARVTKSSWTGEPATLDRIRARLASYSTQLASARAVACTASTAAPALRLCLQRYSQRVDATLAPLERHEPHAAIEVERALFALPSPSACATSHVVDTASPSETSALADAQAAVAFDRPQHALELLSPIAPTSALAGDADVTRGQAALALGNVVIATAAFRRALDLASSAAREDLAIAANLGLAIAVGARQHEPAAGEAYATAARTIALKLGDLRAAAVARRTIGWLAFTGGDANRAAKELEASLAELAPLDVPLEIARAELDLGAVSRKRGDLAGARVHVERAFAIRRDALGPDHPETIRIDEERAKIDAADGKAGHARELMEHQVARLEQIYGPDHVTLAAPLTTLGAAQVAAGDYARATASLERALALYRTDRGELDLDVASAYGNVAGLRLVQGKFDEAVELDRAAIASARSVLGDNHPDLAPMYFGLGVALASSGRYADAAVADAHAIEIYRARAGHDGTLAHALAALALIELGQKQFDAARRDGEEALAILTRLHGATHVALAPPLFALAQIELAAGQLDRARTFVETASKVLEAAKAAPRRLVEQHFVLAQILYRQRHRAEAVALARRALIDLGTDNEGLARRISAWLRAPG
jgi:tetratricopeptide (TPR) repeat protein